MPDISMCESTTCPSRDKCYRFTATPSQRQQAYHDFDALRANRQQCNFFLPMSKYEYTD